MLFDSTRMRYPQKPNSQILWICEGIVEGTMVTRKGGDGIYKISVMQKVHSIVPVINNMGPYI